MTQPEAKVDDIPIAPTRLLKIYLKALSRIGPEAPLATWLVIANALVAAALLAEPILFGRVVDSIARGQSPAASIALWALLGLIGISAGIAIALFADRLAHRRRIAAMTDAFEQVIAMPSGFVSEKGSGTLVRVMLAGSDALFQIVLGFLREHLAAAVQIALLFPAAFWLDPVLASVLAVLATIYAAANFAVIARTQSGQRLAEQRHQAMFGRVGDVIGNVPVIHAFGASQAENVGMRALAGQALSAQLPVLTWWAVLAVSTRAAATIAMVTIFAIGAARAASGAITVGEIVTFVAFATLLISRLDQLGGAIGRAAAQAPTLDALFSLLEAAAPQDAPEAISLNTVAGRVTFDAVSFKFPGSNVGLTDVTFEVAPGQTAAFVGRTGAGKSTALALLQRIRDPQKGRVALDGFDVRDLSYNSLRASLAVVFQDPGLFNRTIRENLLIGRPSATQAEVEQAAHKAEAHDFILSKPGGYDFVIGERGAALSGGERQRLSIARAILKDAPVLLLDEATSALDPVTEARVKRALDAAREGRTTLIIAHRLSTIQDADIIYVFEQGRVVERGDYTSLKRRGGLFSELAAEAQEADS